MRVSILALFGAVLMPLLGTSPAHADWTGKGEAGLVIASGNTETETANAKVQFASEIGKWKHQFGGAALYASSEPDGTTAQRWEAFEQTDYNFSPRTFSFGAVRYEDDEFSGSSTRRSFPAVSAASSSTPTSPSSPARPASVTSSSKRGIRSTTPAC